MTAPIKHWYLVAYDVRAPKRLRRVHYYLRKRALAVQKSVFAMETDSGALAEVQKGLLAIADPREDDLRLYSIPGPAAVWTAGKQGQRFEGLYGAHDAARPQPAAGDAKRSRMGRWIQGLFGREAA
jgi:CRISPR-associated protein Cas2